MKTRKNRRQPRPFIENIGMCEHGETCKNCCWPWQRTLDRHGYGRSRYEYYGLVETYTHRIAWVIHHQMIIPEDRLVAHTCHTRSCCNHHHLTLCTYSHVMTIQKAKRRQRQEQGRRVGNEKLEPEQVHEVIAMAARGLTQAEIAKKFGLSQPTISHIVSGKTWRHLHAG